MMNVYNLMIVDESGSMGHLREATLSGINETLDTIRQSQKEFAETQQRHVTLVLFSKDHSHPFMRTLIDCQPIGEVPENFSDYMPHGCTPLYDAMGQSLVSLTVKGFTLPM